MASVRFNKTPLIREGRGCLTLAHDFVSRTTAPEFNAVGYGRIETLLAPNNAPQKPTLVNKALKFYCKDSPSTRVLTSVRNGAAIGAVRRAFTGFVSGEIFGGEVTLGLSGVAGAGLGAFIQGTIGATTGVIKGFASAAARHAAGAYAPGS